MCIPNYLASILKREKGNTFIELVTEKRMDTASELLVFTHLRVSQIAAAAGHRLRLFLPPFQTGGRLQSFGIPVTTSHRFKPEKQRTPNSIRLID